MARMDPHSYFCTEQPRTEHLHLKWELDFANRQIRGTATLRFASPSTGHLDLDSRGLSIASVVAGDGRPVPFTVDAEDAILGSRIRLDLPPGTVTVTLAYETSAKATALQWLEPAQTLGGKKPFLFSQCQAIHARTIAPLQDTPAARITYTAEVTVPEGLETVMSAGGEGDFPTGDGRRTFKFRMPQAIPPYLLALAVGELASREIGPRSRIFAEPSTVDMAAYEFGEVESMIRTAEGLFGPYDWERFDLLLLPPSFPYGGMENPRLTFLTPTLLAGDRSLVAVVAHELAHSWTGNLVTNANAEHFWINEGFTVWAERRILEALYGKERATMGWAIGGTALRKAYERFGEGSPYTKLKTDLQGVDPDEVFSEIPYEKGARFIALLEREVGREAFDGFVREYMKRFRFTSITHIELLGLLEEKFPGISQRVHAEEWLYGSGIPDNAPVFHSEKLEKLNLLGEGWGTQHPALEELKKWTPQEMLIFLQSLPRTLSHEDCRWLERELDLPDKRNYEIVVEWLAIALASDYEPCFATAREVLGKVGRMKYLRSLYGAMQTSPRTRALAKELFHETELRLHSLSRSVIQGMIQKYPVD